MCYEYLMYYNNYRNEMITFRFYMSKSLLKLQLIHITFRFFLVKSLLFLSPFSSMDSLHEINCPSTYHMLHHSLNNFIQHCDGGHSLMFVMWSLISKNKLVPAKMCFIEIFSLPHVLTFFHSFPSVITMWSLIKI